MRYMLAAVWVLCLCTTALAQQKPITVPRVPTPPTVDGHGNDPAWQNAPTVHITHVLRGGKHIPDTAVRLCRDDANLYVLYTCQEPNFSPGHDELGRTHDSEIWWTDCVTLVLAPDPARPQLCYNLYIGRNGQVRDEYYNPGLELRWTSHLKVCVTHNDKEWTVEMALPLSALSRCPIAGDQWKANFGRIRYQGPGVQVASWQPMRGTWLEPDRFGTIDLPGISSVPAVKQQNDACIAREKQTLLDQCTQWRKALPEQPQSPFVQQVVAQLQQCAAQLQAASDPMRALALIRSAQETLPRRAGVAHLVAQAHQSLVVLPVSAMDKLRAEQLPKTVPPQRVDLFAAKGEAQSKQLLLVADAPMTGVTVSSTALKVSDGNATIVPEIRRVGYVPVRRPTPGGSGMPGLWPDPLFDNGPSDLSPQANGDYLLTCWVPADAQPGDYAGTVTVAAGAHQVQLPVHLKVYDVALPKISRLRTDFSTGGDRAYKELLLRYRMCPMGKLPWDHVFTKDSSGKWSASWEQFDKAVNDWLARGATSFHIDGILRWHTHVPPEADRAEVSAKLKLTEQHLTAKGWTKRFYFYSFDEPGSSELANIMQLCQFVHRYGPHLQVMMTFYDPSMWALQGSINVWIPQSFMFYPFLARYMQEQGDQVWTYVCIGNTGLTFPDVWKIDWTGTAPRAVGWWLWKYHCDGFLYWQTRYWPDDPYTDTVGFPLGNGDGYLFYPNRNPKSSEPALPSLRAALTRDGFEDYDLLALLHDRVQTVLASDKLYDDSQAWLKQARKALDAATLVPAMNQFDHHPRDYEQRHHQLLRLLTAPLK